ncbi:MAG TPA: hypothetical protein VMY99_04510 [Nevskiaceae bacterium]|nr:hypothetical protein [Nevskiaceae bacterium]
MKSIRLPEIDRADKLGLAVGVTLGCVAIVAAAAEGVTAPVDTWLAGHHTHRAATPSLTSPLSILPGNALSPAQGPVELPASLIDTAASRQLPPFVIAR